MVLSRSSQPSTPPFIEPAGMVSNQFTSVMQAPLPGGRSMTQRMVSPKLRSIWTAKPSL